MEKLKKKINGLIDKFFIIALRPLTLLPKTTITQKKKNTFHFLSLRLSIKQV